MKQPIHTPIPTQQVPQPIEQPIHTEVPLHPIWEHPIPHVSESYEEIRQLHSGSLNELD